MILILTMVTVFVMMVYVHGDDGSRGSGRDVDACRDFHDGVGDSGDVYYDKRAHDGDVDDDTMVIMVILVVILTKMTVFLCRHDDVGCCDGGDRGDVHTNVCGYDGGDVGDDVCEKMW